MWAKILRILSPYAPHIAEELWEKGGNKPVLSLEKWPEYNESMTIESEVTIVLQINNKNRSKIEMSKESSKEELEKAAFGDERIKTLLEGKKIIKTIIVPGKLVNIVAN